MLTTAKFSVINSKSADLTFSEKISSFTNYSASVDFSSFSILEIINDDIEKCRHRRRQMLSEERICLPKTIMTQTFQLLCRETDFHYDPKEFRLRDELTKLLGIDPISLEELHIIFKNDIGRRGDRHEKRKLLVNVVDPVENHEFRELYDRFVRTIIAPHVSSVLSDESVIYYQAFPCLRIVRPGEFSIGAHADISYGFSQANINFYVPLTRIFGTNSLVLESVPGLEDWHTIDADVGYIKRFYGVLCSHFTTTNNTSQTRVSLDLRVIPGSCWQQEHDHFTATEGYYAKCTRPQSNTSAAWERSGNLLPPDHRVGFPFTKV